jgi:hypothetical protein
VRRFAGLRAGVALVALLGSGCATTPMTHTTEPYRGDPEEARALEQRAAQVCVERRGEDDLPPHPFTTDACSSWPDASWKHCCVEHDISYWCGGSAEDRRRADRELRDCVAETAGCGLPGMMRAGVWIGGAPWQPAPWRWGYGWDYYRAYDAEADTPLEVESRAVDRAE